MIKNYCKEKRIQAKQHRSFLLSILNNTEIEREKKRRKAKAIWWWRRRKHSEQTNSRHATGKKLATTRRPKRKLTEKLTETYIGGGSRRDSGTVRIRTIIFILFLSISSSWCSKSIKSVLVAAAPTCNYVEDDEEDKAGEVEKDE